MRGYFGVLSTLLVMDGVWLLVLARDFYTQALAHLLAKEETLWAVVIFYLIYAFGIYTFVVQPAQGKASTWLAIKRGAIFGLVSYSVYDLTNQAMLIQWPITLTIVDIVWGVCISATAASVGLLATRSTVVSRRAR